MKDPKQNATSFARELAARLGERLQSALLYGSVARGEAVPGTSDINVLVLLDRIDGDVLRSASPLARRWAETGNTAPLFMATTEWRRAADAFAIELADMHDAHEVVYGADPLVGLEVDPGELRLQAERELRGKLLQLREGMLLAAEDEEALGRLLLVALPSFVTYMRAALRLAGREVPLDSESVVRAAADLVGGDPTAFLEAWQARRRGRPIRARIGGPLLDGYYALAESTAAFVDTYSETRDS